MSRREPKQRGNKTRVKRRLLNPPARYLDKSAHLADHPSTLFQRAKLDPGLLSSRHVLQLQRTLGNQAASRLLKRTVQQKEKHDGKNITGMPDDLKMGVENLSGLTMDDVKVHYNSDKPAELHASALTQGTEIYMGSEQERHLPHEAWHVAQQKQGRVKPTAQLMDAKFNDDAALENEADIMGPKALQVNSVAPLAKNVSTTPPNAPIQFVNGELAAALAAMKARKRKKEDAGNAPARTLTTEKQELNAALLAEGYQFQVADESQLRAVKKAAGFGATTSVHPDFNLLRSQFFTALKLGAFNNIDGDDVAKADYANRVQARLFKLKPSLKRAKVEDGRKFEKYNVTIQDCIKWADRITEQKVYEITDKSLATVIANKLGKGLLAGYFPGEIAEATPENAGDDRVEVMTEFGKSVVQDLETIEGVNPELTGSLVLKPGGYTGIPEDIDVNITTKPVKDQSGKKKDRDDIWQEVKQNVDDNDGESLILENKKKIRVFKMSDIDEKTRILEKRFGYSLKYTGIKDNFIVPLEVEVKDVGGAEWTGHLSEKAEERKTEDEGTSQPKWILLDTLTRIIAHKTNLKEALANRDEDRLVGVPEAKKEAKWRKLVLDEGLKLSRNKKLWEKMSVSSEMSKEKLVSEDAIETWIMRNVASSKRDEYRALFATVKGQKDYENWLTTV